MEKKQLFSAINQLQSYLTWRDTKSALIIFVKDKNISSIIEKINYSITEHPQFIKKYKLLNDYDTIWSHVKNKGFIKTIKKYP